jgi:ABC-type sugar transport system substrate-binding protein
MALPVQAEKPLRVALLSPSGTETGFWGSLISMARVAANDLNIDLNVVVSAKSVAETRLDGLEIIRSTNPPDYLITSYLYHAAENFIPEASKNGVKVFIINNSLPDYERLLFGEPREKYANWIAHSYVNEFEMGQKLADILYQEAMRLRLPAATGNILHMSGLAAGSEIVELRNDFEHVRALKLFADGKKDVTLDGVYYAYWSRAVAKAVTTEILRIHTGTRVIWAQNQLMAQGAIDELIEKNIKPGKEMVIGCYNWVPGALKAIKKGDMHVAMGGHFLAAAAALVLIHDYHYGIDFIDDTGVKFITPMYAITADNVGIYERVLNTSEWDKIDFRKFSKKYNPDLKRYNFTPENIFGIQSN